MAMYICSGCRLFELRSIGYNTKMPLCSVPDPDPEVLELFSHPDPDHYRAKYLPKSSENSTLVSERRISFVTKL